MKNIFRPLQPHYRTKRSVNRFRQHYRLFAGAVDEGARATEIITIAQQTLDLREKERLLKILARELKVKQARLGESKTPSAKQEKAGVESAHNGAQNKTMPCALAVPDDQSWIEFVPPFLRRSRPI